MKQFYLNFIILSFYNLLQSQVQVDVNWNVKHSVEGFDTFDRAKYINIHANQGEQEWDGTNFTPNLRDHFLNGYDVYLGRDTGGITWYLNQVGEDPNRSGYANPTELVQLGQNARNNFESRTYLHPYEQRKNLVIAGQLNPFWTGTNQKPTGQGWYLADATATGEYMGNYINEFHGRNGQKMPAYVEIINEPAYDLLGGPSNSSNSLQEIADFHVKVADGIRSKNSDVLIGGYTTAFPNFEVGNFERWKNRWKLFMDVAGEKMDFWSIHLYDFPAFGGKQILRSGSNIEATFDMMEQYSQLSFNEVKPIVVSEYGAQMHDYSNQQWSPYRDWLHIKASNAQMMSFLERPNVIASAINFIVVKGEWGYDSDKGIPYNHRLMRKTNEPNSYTGEWVYTEMVKFYQFWSQVKGTRVDTTTDDLDIQVDAYVEGNKGYLIINNLNFTETTVNVKSFEENGLPVSNVRKKHLTLKNNQPVLEDDSLGESAGTLTIGAESAMILEYTFDSSIEISELSTETKYYASSYLEPIHTNQAINFQINGVSKESYGEAVLRIGLGRDHGKSLEPLLKFNNKTIAVPTDWKGYDQSTRDSFFGVLEIPIPFDYLEENNTIILTFPDDGGHISTTTLQVFNFSKDIRVINPINFAKDHYKIESTGSSCPNSGNGSIFISAKEKSNYIASIIGPDLNQTISFTENATISSLKPGKYSIQITVVGFPDYKAEFSTVLSEPENLFVSSKIDLNKKALSLEISGGETYFIDLNGVITQTQLNKIELPLKGGRNHLSISTNKDCLGVHSQEFNLNNLLTVFPNPVGGELTVLVPEELIGGEALLTNLNGAILKKIKLIKISSTITLSDFPSGIYILITTNNNLTFNQKIIIR